MVKGIKIIFSVIKSNFAGWITNYKIYLCVVILLIFVYDNYANVFAFAGNEGFRVTPWLFPFLFTHPFLHLVIFSCVIFLFSDAPFVHAMQLLVMSRSGKRSWYMAQMIYVLLCCVSLTVFLAVLPAAANGSMIVFKGDWGKVITTLAVNHSTVHPVSYEVVSRYTAVQAWGYSALMFILLTFFIGMLLFFCNTVFRRQNTGVIAAAAFVILDWTCYLTGSSYLLWISPVSWINISAMAYAGDTDIPAVPYGITAILLMDIGLVLAVSFLAKRRDINVLTEEIQR